MPDKVQRALRVEAVADAMYVPPCSVRLWRDNEVVAHGERLKRTRLAELGLIELECSAFAVDGRPELGMVVPLG